MNSLYKDLKGQEFPVTGRTTLGGVFCQYSFVDFSSPLLITFSHAGNFTTQEDIDDLDYSAWGYDFITKKNLNVISFSCINSNTWYREDDFHEELKKLGPMLGGFKKILGYGASMGAFATGAFARVLKMDGVLLLNPISTLNMKLASFETRFRGGATAQNWVNQFHDGADFDCPGIIVYDPLFNLDRAHAVRYNAKVAEIKFAGVGHGIAIHLLRLGLLSKLFKEFVNDSVDLNSYKSALRAKRKYVPYYRWMLSEENIHLTKKRGEIIKKHFDSLTGYLGEDYQPNVKVTNLLRDAAMGLEKTDPDLAIRLLEEAVSRRPNGVFMIKNLAKLKSVQKKAQANNAADKGASNRAD